jgi:hypothetical protein
VILDRFDHNLVLQRGRGDLHPSCAPDCRERHIAIADRQIDGLVYELYGLSEEEIKIVEDAAR